MVSSRAFWVPISYRLAACFTRIRNTFGIEIYWRLFQHFETPSGKLIIIIRQLVGRRNMSIKSLQGRRTAYDTRITLHNKTG